LKAQSIVREGRLEGEVVELKPVNALQVAFSSQEFPLMKASQPPSMAGVTPPLPWVLLDRVMLGL
jgi:hypothetical protein